MTGSEISTFIASVSLVSTGRSGDYFHISADISLSRRTNSSFSVSRRRVAHVVGRPVLNTGACSRRLRLGHGAAVGVLRHWCCRFDVGECLVDETRGYCQQPGAAAWFRRACGFTPSGMLVPEVIEMPLIGDPPNNLAAVSLIRAAIADDADSGIFIMSEHGGCEPGSEGKKAAQFMMPLAALSATALLSAHGCNVERILKVLDAWAAEYAGDPSAANDGRSAFRPVRCGPGS
jgi:hypothetical protein